MKWLNGIIDSMDVTWSKLWEMVQDREAWCDAVQRGRKEADKIERLKNNEMK